VNFRVTSPHTLSLTSFGTLCQLGQVINTFSLTMEDTWLLNRPSTSCGLTEFPSGPTLRIMCTTSVNSLWCLPCCPPPLRFCLDSEVVVEGVGPSSCLFSSLVLKSNWRGTIGIYSGADSVSRWRDCALWASSSARLYVGSTSSSVRRFFCDGVTDAPLA